MGKVIEPGKKRPNGRKIAELRKKREWRQKTLCHEARISERLLRNIELENHPVPATKLTDIATALGVTPNDITLPPPGGTPDTSANLLKLKAIRFASDLRALADSAHEYDWKLRVNPTAATVEDMQHLMVIVERLVRGFEADFIGPDELSTNDEFDKMPFGDIPRLARLQELLEKLREGGVGVIAGNCVRQTLEKTGALGLRSVYRHGFEVPSEPIRGHDDLVLVTETILLVRFVRSEIDEEVIEIGPRRSLRELLDEFAGQDCDSKS
jgi:transcriptional regulator with XRE-family HTH domain